MSAQRVGRTCKRCFPDCATRDFAEEDCENLGAELDLSPKFDQRKPSIGFFALHHQDSTFDA